MEVEATRRATDKAKAEDWIGSGALQKELTELMLLTQIDIIDGMNNRIQEQISDIEQWLAENSIEATMFDSMAGQRSAYRDIAAWLLVLLNERADMYEDLQKQKQTEIETEDE